MRISLFRHKLSRGISLAFLPLLLWMLFAWYYRSDAKQEDLSKNSLVENRASSEISNTIAGNPYTSENATFFSVSKLKFLVRTKGNTATFDLGNIGLDASQIDDLPIMAKSVSLKPDARIIIVEWDANSANYEDNEKLTYDRKRKLLIRESQGFSQGNNWDTRTVLARNITDKDFHRAIKTEDYSLLDRR